MSLISLVGMLIMLVITGVYIYFFTDFSLTFRIISVVNVFFGIIFLFSMVATTYQQYQTYLLVEQGKGLMDIFQNNLDTSEPITNERGLDNNEKQRF